VSQENWKGGEGNGCSNLDSREKRGVGVVKEVGGGAWGAKREKGNRGSVLVKI